MSQFPNNLDNDSTLPRVDQNITDIGGDAINALRSAVFAIEANLGLNAQGAASSIGARLNTSLDPLGRILPSALAGIGLVYLPITDSQISPTAGIQETKLNLIYSTSTLYNLYQNLKNAIDVLNGFLSLTGVKVEPHIDGLGFNHDLSAILVDTTLPMLKTLPGASIVLPGTSVQSRDTTNSDTLVNDISNDLLIHEKADSSSGIVAAAGGTVPPTGFGHVAAGIFLETSTFNVVPQTNNSLQLFAEFVDNSSLLLLGSRTQNLFSNGISVAARSFSLTADGYGSSIVPPTSIVAYLLDVPPGPQASAPVDDINHGDNVILFQPTTQQLSTFNFDAQFAQVMPGDLLTVNYGNGITAQFAVESVKAIINGGVRTYAVRINTKNLYSTSSGMARIDRPLYNTNKYGVLSVARCPNQMSVLETLITAQPRGAIVLGNGFNPSMFDSTHYNLYLTMYQGGNPANQLALPAVDITGNQGITPGQYTLASIVDAANLAFHAAGFNYRFVAFQYEGEFGIMLADAYNNTSFSIVSGVVNASGVYTATSLSSYPNNVVDNYGNGTNPVDPLGFGIGGANVATPPYSSSYSAVAAAQFAPTLIFYPLSRNYYYTNGVERDTLRSDPAIINQIIDGYGDGYWPATILPSPATIILANRVQVAYSINLDLSTSGIEVGKSIVIQPAFSISDPRYNFRDYGRFIIQNIAFSGCDTSSPLTVITVYDGVHGAGTSPAITSTNIPVNVYFSDDSVSFNGENVADQSSAGYPYKRFFEVLIDQNGHTYTHERARFSTTGIGSIANIGLYNVSPKLLGYTTAITSSEYLRAIQLNITSYVSTTGVYVGQLVNPGAPLVNFGPITTGKKGQPVRFYDETNIDYIDFILDETLASTSFAAGSVVINLFQSLAQDQENFLLSTCQINDTTGQASYLNDKRQFGNTSEENFTTSAKDYIAAPTRLLQENGIIRGFDILGTATNQIEFDGGVAIVDGKIVQINPQNVEIPAILEAVGGNIGTTVNVITWFICVNSSGELALVASTDYDPNGSFASIYSGLSLDNTRIFYAMNPNVSSPAAYQIRGDWFSDLVLNQTDLVPIAVAVATTTVSGSTYRVSTLTASDARRYVGDGFGGLADPFVLSPNGSFRSLSTVSTWLTQLNNFVSATSENNTSNSIGNTVIVKGDVIITSPITLNFLNPVKFVGDAGIFVVQSATGITIANGVIFDGVRFDYTHTPTIGEGYISLSLINSSHSAIYCNATANNQNIEIRNCIFNSFNADHYPFISFELSTNQAIVQNVIINNNRFVANAQDLRAAIVFNSKATTFAGTFPYFPKLANIVIENNFCNNDQMIVITALRNGVSIPGPMPACTNVRLVGNTCGTIGFLTSYDIPSTSDNSTNSGLVYDKGDTLTISNNTCKFVANIDGYLGQYVSFQTLATYGPGLGAPINSSLQWEPATFSVISVTTGSSTVVTINTSNPSAFVSGMQATVVGMTGVTPTHIYGATVTITPISSNSVSLTFSTSSTGTYSGTGAFVYVLFNIINNGTGSFTITNNTCNWIQVGTYSDAHGGGDGVISDNKLFPYNSTFLQNYTDTICSVAPVNAAVVLNPDNGSSTTNSIISNNLMSEKTDYNGTLHNYTYDYGILSFNNVSIKDNSVNSCITSSGSTGANSKATIIAVTFGNVVTGNSLTRGTAILSSYINGTGNSVYFNPAFSIAGVSNCTITHNIFDSIYLDTSGTTNDVNVIFTDGSEYNYNINQVLYATVPVYEMFTNLGVGASIFPGSFSGHETQPTGVQVPISINSNIEFTANGSSWFGMTNLSNYLPAGANILYVILGIFADTTNGNGFTPNSGTPGTFSLATIKEPNASIDIRTSSALLNSLADVANNTTFSQIYTYLPSVASFALISSANVSALSSSTQYLQWNQIFPPSQNMTIGKGYDIKLIFQAYNIAISANPTYLDLAPIIIRYTFV